mmetsp:Transcript_7877/g.13169  ORF Transcript_7877/g.13169 Transcript_7877/m.13169 type:complete len:211 (+) Transcript_7877:216-848(+)
MMARGFYFPPTFFSFPPSTTLPLSCWRGCCPTSLSLSSYISFLLPPIYSFPPHSSSAFILQKCILVKSYWRPTSTRRPIPFVPPSSPCQPFILSTSLPGFRYFFFFFFFFLHSFIHSSTAARDLLTPAGPPLPLNNLIIHKLFRRETLLLAGLLLQLTVLLNPNLLSNFFQSQQSRHFHQFRPHRLWWCPRYWRSVRGWGKELGLQSSPE